MPVSFRQVMDELEPERRSRIETETARLQAEYLTMQDMRKAKELTQAKLAETLGVKQATIAQMEKRSDLLISTLRSYVEAMGGNLKLVVEFPGRNEVVLEGLSDQAPEARRRSRKAG